VDELAKAPLINLLDRARQESRQKRRADRHCICVVRLPGLAVALIGSFWIDPGPIEFIIPRNISMRTIIEHRVIEDARSIPFLNFFFTRSVHRLCLCEPYDGPLHADLT
jgi:hypothetical protein